MLLSSKGGEKRQEEKESEKSKRKEEREKENIKPKKKKEGRRETFPYRGKNEHQTGNKRQRGNWQKEREKAKREEVFERAGLARRSAKIAKLGGGKKFGSPARKPPRQKNGILIGNFQAEVPKKAISFHFLAFWVPRNRGLPRKTCRKTVFFEGAFVFVIDALLVQVIFESAALVAPSAKIAEPGGAKKVGRSGREGP